MVVHVCSYRIIGIPMVWHLACVSGVVCRMYGYRAVSVHILLNASPLLFGFCAPQRMVRRLETLPVSVHHVADARYEGCPSS